MRGSSKVLSHIGHLISCSIKRKGMREGVAMEIAMREGYWESCLFEQRGRRGGHPFPSELGRVEQWIAGLVWQRTGECPC